MAWALKSAAARFAAEDGRWTSVAPSAATPVIAAIVPPHAVTTHTLFCLRTPLPLDEQRVLCALLNSFVANFLVRLRVNTHVTVALITRLPLPLVRRGHAGFEHLERLARMLLTGGGPVEDMEEYVELLACAALLPLVLLWMRRERQTRLAIA